MKYFDKLCYFIILWMAYLYFHSWTWFLFFLVFVIVIFLYQEIQRKKGKEKEEKNAQARKFFLTFLTAYASSHSFDYGYQQAIEQQPKLKDVVEKADSTKEKLMMLGDYFASPIYDSFRYFFERYEEKKENTSHFISSFFHELYREEQGRKQREEEKKKDQVSLCLTWGLLFVLFFLFHQYLPKLEMFCYASSYYPMVLFLFFSLSFLSIHSVFER